MRNAPFMLFSICRKSRTFATVEWKYRINNAFRCHRYGRQNLSKQPHDAGSRGKKQKERKTIYE